MKQGMIWLGAAIACGGLGLSAPASAGPCSDQIASLGKALSENAQLGPATTGALSGSGPQSGLKSAAAASPGSAPSLQGTSAEGKLGGEGGTKEMNAASSQVATSAQDVRRQQAGLPTMAADPGAKLSPADQRMSEAKMELAKAQALDQRDDASCKDAVNQAQKLMQQPG